jgi:hypothetical protein
MQEQQLPTAEIKVNDNQSVTAFVIEQDIDRPLAIVDFAVLKRLTDYLPKAPFDEIKRNFIHNIRDNVHNMDELVNALSEELAFHRSVNVIKEVRLPGKPEPELTPELRY